MTDDEAIEAAIKAYDDCGYPERDFVTAEERMRAAIAAADKARVNGFDADRSAEEILSKTCDSFSCLAAAKIELLRAFATGLAKGEADRAALVEALEDVRENGMMAIHTEHWDSSGMYGANCPVCIQQRRVGARVRAALALVRKGV